MNMPYPAVKNARKNGGRAVSDARDVTELKLAEEDLQIEKNKLLYVIDAMTDSLTILNRDFDIIFQNKRSKASSGDHLGEKCYRAYESRDKVCEGCPVEIAFRDGHSHTSERKNLLPAGEVSFWENTANPVRDAGGKVVICLKIGHEVTKRKNAEKALQESQKFVSSLLENAPHATLVINPDTSVRYVNPAWEHLNGWTLAEVVGLKAPYPWWPKELGEDFLPVYNEAIRQPVGKGEIIALKKNGESYWIDMNWVSVTQDGEFQYAIVNSVDINERKETEAKLQAQRQLIESILANMLEGVLVVDAADRVILANESARRIFHRGKKAIINKLLKDIVPVEPLLKLCHSVKLGKRPDNMLEFRFRANNIEKIIAGGAVRMDGERTLLTFIDMSREREEKEKLYLTDRLASIGEMAVGLAHELNNPLTGILSLSEMLLDSDIPPESKEDLQSINSEAKRAANIVKNVLFFTRNNNYENGHSSANEVLRNVLRLREYEEKANTIKIVTHLREDLPDVQIDQFQLQQVFLNIILNAEAAIKETGRPGVLTVTTDKANHHVNITFGDNGCGIKKDVLPRIFDPFFTTKEIGKGTGLGLSICFGIVSQHSGKISVKTQVNKGTAFTVRMPAVP
jgi:two-component system NtrC family sensor kinase